MSIRIIKQGLLDTVQDDGRYGYQQLGINPGGVMDKIAYRMANILVGNKPFEPVIEMHFPAAEILFESNVLIAICGADFAAEVAGIALPIHQPILLEKGSLLCFHTRRTGARAYLAIHGGLQLTNWLGSYATNLEASAGGYQGRALKKQDVIPIKQKRVFGHIIDQTVFHILPWQASLKSFYHEPPIRILSGNEFDNLTDAAKLLLASNPFTILPDSNRMGYRLQSSSLSLKDELSLISTAVTCGTIQLLPNGQLIILMADHQTTGGYPRVGHVCAADIPVLAQKNAGDTLHFKMISIKEAEEALLLLESNLQQLENACTFRLQGYMNA
jgi:antagonist of KipI